ncbi:holin family protein [Oceaniglobus trochenteri]|uniref:holin family protein n=1 Tax=Oceaniglobus trochenteri TaxID=2763260 RepID=UPI001CFFC467|nr:holin family protein [Oceaniglobus trochenteri]
MGMIGRILDALLGNGNVIARTAEVFRENAEAAGQRQGTLSAAALAQFAAESARPACGRFDRFIDGLNRLPRPMLALGTLGLFVAAMVDPVWFSSRMVGLALIPEPLWWLLGAIVSFYFGARHQAKGQDFQRSIAASLARAPQVADTLATLQSVDTPRKEPEVERQTPQRRDLAPGAQTATPAAPAARPLSDNAALDDWRAGRG